MVPSMVAASLDGVPERGTVASEVEKRGSMGMGKKMCGVAAEVLRCDVLAQEMVDTR